MKEESNNNTLDTTVDEWQAEVSNLYKDDPGSTLTELEEIFNRTRYATRKIIVGLVASGRCIQGIATRIDASGRKISVSVYQLKKEGKR